MTDIVRSVNPTLQVHLEFIRNDLEQLSKNKTNNVNDLFHKESADIVISICIDLFSRDVIFTFVTIQLIYYYTYLLKHYLNNIERILDENKLNKGIQYSAKLNLIMAPVHRMWQRDMTCRATEVSALPNQCLACSEVIDI